MSAFKALEELNVALFTEANAGPPGTYYKLLAERAGAFGAAIQAARSEVERSSHMNFVDGLASALRRALATTA